MELNVGYYIRTDKGYITKIKQIQDDNYIFCDNVIKKEFCDSYEQCYSDTINIVKASENIIDLIEVGDYVNGERVIALRKDIPERYIHMNSKDNFIFVEYDLANNWYYGIDTDKIKTVVTKEQFESMKYRVE